MNGIDGPIIDELNATLATVGLVGTVTLIVTFRKPGITPIPARVDSSTLNVDTNVHQSIFRSVEVPFDRTPFGLELEVRSRVCL